MDFRELLLQQQEGGNEVHYDDQWIDYEKLDYDHVRQCSNLPELKAILRVLETGREGMYPHLEQFTRDRIDQVSSKQQGFNSDLGGPRKNMVVDPVLCEELRQWTAQMSKSSSASNIVHAPFSSAIRGSSSQVQTEKSGVNEKIFELPEHEAAPAIFSSEVSMQLPQSQIASLMQMRKSADKSTLIQTSLDFKIKANECLKSGTNGVEEAIQYYTSSLILDPLNATVWSNRAQAHLELSQFQHTVEDATECLKLEPANSKARYRRGLAHLKLANHQEAIDDLSIVKQMDPNDKHVDKLLKDALTNASEA